MRMETTKTIVQVVQELLALLNARNERLHGIARPPEKDKLVKALLDELSLHGDDISSSVDHSDLYFKSDTHDELLFKNAVKKLRENSGEIPESLETIFEKMLNL